MIFVRCMYAKILYCNMYVEIEPVTSPILTSPFVAELQKYRCEVHWIVVVLLRLCVEFKCEESVCRELFNRHVLWMCVSFLSLVKKAAPHLKLILFPTVLCWLMALTNWNSVCFVCCCFSLYCSSVLFFLFLLSLFLSAQQ